MSKQGPGTAEWCVYDKMVPESQLAATYRLLHNVICFFVIGQRTGLGLWVNAICKYINKFSLNRKKKL